MSVAEVFLMNIEYTKKCMDLQKNNIFIIISSTSVSCNIGEVVVILDTRYNDHSSLFICVPILNIV